MEATGGGRPADVAEQQVGGLEEKERNEMKANYLQGRNFQRLRRKCAPFMAVKVEAEGCSVSGLVFLVAIVVLL